MIKMKEKVKNILAHREKTVPILSFPSTQLLGITVKDLIGSADMQVRGMEKIAEVCNMGAILNMMDLSVEAEAFGSKVVFYDDDVPTVEQGIIDDIADAESIVVPEIGAGRTSIYIEGIKKAKEKIKDRPVICGIIGPYSLAGRLFDMTELMMECYDSPDEVKILLEKVTAFLVEYVKAFKAAGADGVAMAEPAAGLLSPDLADEFSMPYVKEIFDAVNSEDFIVLYHNCGGSVGDMLSSVAELDADIYHFGNAIDIENAVKNMPSDKIIMGNIDPVLFREGTAEEIRAEVDRVYAACSKYPNFMISTGCDVPAAAKWENINAYFERIKELYV